MTKPVTSIDKVGQHFVDEPVYAEPRCDLRTPLVGALAEVFGHTKIRLNKFGALEKYRTDVQTLLIRHERTKLRWMKPGPDGKLVPR